MSVCLAKVLFLASCGLNSNRWSTGGVAGFVVNVCRCVWLVGRIVVAVNGIPESSQRMPMSVFDEY